MKKDIEWLVQMIKDERDILRQSFESGEGTPNQITFDEGRDWTLAHVLRMIYNLDEPEALSKELPVIPKFVAEWIDELKQDERPLYSVMSSLMNKTNHEWAVWKNANKDFSEIVAQAWLDGFTVEEVPLYHALIKGHELLTRKYAFKYWSYDTFEDVAFTCELPSQSGRYITEMSKSEWNKLGINDSNADFVKVEG